MQKSKEGENDTMKSNLFFTTKGNINKCSILLRIITLTLIIFTIFSLVIPTLADGSLNADTSAKGKLLYAGGMPFGVKFFSKGVTVAGFCDITVSSGKSVNPAILAGLKINDTITSVNGTEPEGCEDFLSMIENSNGAPLSISYLRENNSYSATLTPVFSADECRYKCGIYIKQGGAGIGTVTYIDPDTLEFGGLGHGICDSQTGSVVEISHGIVTEVNISGIVAGRPGAPGEIKGSLSATRTGLVRANTECGVFGVLSAVPKGIELKKYPIATRNELKEGKAQVLCSLDGSGNIGCYDIEISGINRESRDNKSFTVKVTDKALIERSGGIIQGMSGSTIIQNNRIVGAITHVMINDPTVGYGIFIENMLDTASTISR